MNCSYSPEGTRIALTTLSRERRDQHRPLALAMDPGHLTDVPGADTAPPDS